MAKKEARKHAQKSEHAKHSAQTEPWFKIS